MQALGDARTVLNVGAGTGSYEPCDLEVAAVRAIAGDARAQRLADAAPAIGASAEALPFAGRSFDAAMALSDHHWSDHARGLAELRRVSPGRIVLVTWDLAAACDSWLVRDYFPGFARFCPPDSSSGRVSSVSAGSYRVGVDPA